MSRTSAARLALVAFIGVLLAGVLYFTPKLAPATHKSFTLVLKSKALASGPSLITVNQDDTVTLNVKSDQEGRLMVHGYEKEIAVTAGDEARLTFVADKSGRYFLHLHEGDEHIEISQIEVLPRG
jgi:hypothetical protein